MGSQGKLRGMDCVEQSVRTCEPGGYNMWDMYCRWWQPFGELLTDMERESMQLNRCCGGPQPHDLQRLCLRQLLKSQYLVTYLYVRDK